MGRKRDENGIRRPSSGQSPIQSLRDPWPSFLDGFRLLLDEERHDSPDFITDSRRINWFYHVAVHARLKAFAPVK